MTESKSANLRSDRRNLIRFKLWGSLLWLVNAIMLGGLGRRLILTLFFSLLAAMCLSLADVRIQGGVLLYKRFSRWKTIHQNEIRSSGVVMHPAIGYIRLNHFVYPWGVLYFVLDRNLNPNPFRRAGYGLLRHMKGEPLPQADSNQPKAKAPELLVVAVCGALLYSIWRMTVQRPSALARVSVPVHPGLIAIQQGFWHLLGALPVSSALCVIFALLTIYKRTQPQVWWYAFFAGTFFSMVFLHWL